jgi:hypothetical protein
MTPCWIHFQCRITVTTPAMAQSVTEEDNATTMAGNMTADYKTGGNWTK